MGRSKLRTATVASGKPRRRKWRLRALTAGVVAAGALVSLAGPAQAYDASTCDAQLSVPVTDVDRFYMWQGSVDFGDGLHWGGVPRGDAVVCWGGGAGDTAVIGRLYADSTTNIFAAADVRFYRTDGSYFTSEKKFFYGSWGTSKAIGFLATGADDVDRVRIRLWNCGPYLDDCSLVNALTINRGD